MKKEEHILQKSGIVVAAAVFCCLLWGSAFPCIKLGYKLFEIPAGDTAAQILFAGLRFALAGVLTILAGSLLQGKVLKPSRSSYHKVFKLCLCQTVIQYLFFYIGLAHTTGVKGSIVNAVNTFFAILVACQFFRLEKLDKQKIIGCIIGFAGVVIVNLGGTFEMRFTLMGDGFLLVSSFVYALSTVLIKIYGKDDDPVMLSGYQFTLGGILMAVFGMIMGGQLSVITAAGIGLLLYMAFISAGAYTLWGLLLKYNPVSKVAVFGFCIPIFGVLLSTVILQENTGFQARTLVALLCVCIGIIIVNYKKTQEE